MIKRTFSLSKLEYACNTLELLGILAVLFIAFLFQVLLHDLPCPLCLLQRVGFFGIALGFLLNLRFGFKPSHYGIVILSAIFTSFVALRQIAIHVIPGTGAYGQPFLGFHLYTWSFIISMIVIVTTTLLLSIDRQYFREEPIQRPFNKGLSIIFITAILLVLANVVTVLGECGFKSCPQDPTEYHFHL